MGWCTHVEVKLDALRGLGLAREGLGPAASGVVGAPVQNRAVGRVRGRRVRVDVADWNDFDARPSAATLARHAQGVNVRRGPLGNCESDRRVCIVTQREYRLYFAYALAEVE